MRRIFASLFLSGLVVLTGCSTGLNSSSSQTSALTTSTLNAQGIVHGGRQPVSGSTIKLWQVGTTGDGSPSVSLLTNPITSGPDGSFSITANYTCPNSGTPSNNLVYITANGGNPGSGTNNSALVLMAALGQCGSLSSSTFISLNEVTTVGSLAALYPYATSYTAIGAGASDASAFTTAFGLVPEYINITSGSAPGPSLPSGYYASSTELNTLGNIVASCINSVGGVAGDSSPCGNLFTLATPPSGPAPTNTVAAVINILNNPTRNVSGLFNLGGAIAPFQPSLGAAPTSWALPIVGTTATPTFSVAGGTYSSAQFVTLSDTTPGAVIHYTIDGSTPTSSSPTYSGTITVSSPSETIQAIAVASGYTTSAVASATYIITGSTATYNLGGQVFSTNSCSGTAVPPITMTLKQGSTVVQTTTTSNGLYTFSGVPNGITYTVTPSISGPTSIFYPAVRTIAVNGSNISNSFFNSTLGYTVSGTVAYSGAKTGRTYLVLSCGGASYGTSISTKGAFTIQGVPSGSYTLQSYMDNIGSGSANASNPSGSTSVTVASSNYSGASVTLADPATVTLATAPILSGIAGLNSGALVQYMPILNGSDIETPTSYTLQWSTSSSFSTITDSQTFPANGTNTDVWLLNSGRNASLTDGSVYYFRAYGTSAGTAVSSYSNVYGPVTIGAPSGGNTVTGAVSYASTATGPLYTGFYNQDTGEFYGKYIANPVSAQAYSAQVPNGSNYLFVGIVDQNNNGVIDAGDISSIDSGNAATVISGPATNVNLTLPSANATASVTTNNLRTIISGVQSQGMNISFDIEGVIKKPVAVTLISGPNVLTPIDIAICGAGNNCGHGFQANLFIANSNPIVGDTYTFNVTYSDGTTGTVTAAVTGTVSAFATGLTPQTGGSVSTTPTLSWTDPVNASNYTYSFTMFDPSGNAVWRIPGPNSNSDGFSSSITSLAWGTDPTDSNNKPSPTSLVLNTIYTWAIRVQDSNGNSAQTQVQYQP